ncbi:hypothetical protein BDQ12DRAFT_618491 [Crucibulum laeve]|uniref:Uncharacterized protein n=1 Tax=Crucibulum laeve TaxID=68775 RepID=A0A5C3LEZ3_9AGAR|nr:hypothetical protein BDQ12DRAFT_618491 [Crucibulum laeve]
MKLAEAAGSAAIATFRALNDAQAYHIPGSPYATMRHTRPWVYYQGVSTVVPISILGRQALPDNRRIVLQKRGWRTGLLGWTIGGWLGGNLGKSVDVTPEIRGKWQELEESRRLQYEKEANEYMASPAAPKGFKTLETHMIHIPVAVGDGYFRLIVYPSEKSRKPLAETAPFRVGSLSLSSAQPRGASITTIVPELVLKSASVAGHTAAWGAFYTAFPFIKAAQMLPGTSNWGTWALNRAYKMAGGDDKQKELMERYKVEERRKKAEVSVYKNVPFGTLGVRTAYDLEEDAKRGKGGVYYSHW